MKKMLSILSSFALLLVLAVPAYANPSQTTTNNDYQGLVDVGGINLFVNIQGSANRDNGEPAVVFESERTVDSTLWTSVQSSVSQVAQTVSYDRADLGQSDASNVAYTAENQADQLHELLQNSNVEAPYLLVTHSYGAAISRVFADKYKDEVAGIVLVDAAHQDQEKTITDTYLSPIYAEAFKAQFVDEGGYNAILGTLDELAATLPHDSLRNIPLEILSANEHGLGPAIETQWQAYQTSFLGLSNYSHQTIVDSTHYIMLDHPEYVVTAINNLNLIY